jgi:fructan beta-fructosidase
LGTYEVYFLYFYSYSISWGHARSKDLLHWENLPVAIYEENKIMMFSGSAVQVNQSLVLMYAGQDYNTNTQTMNIATSPDGIKYKKFEGNPVIDIHSANFRDPKVFWFEAGQYYVSAIVLSDLRKVRLYKSSDLKTWTILSDFGPAGSLGGIYECPDVIFIFSL